jgi:TetR/AcrR family transcriptional regulator, cholesterol catabolism regulator
MSSTARDPSTRTAPATDRRVRIVDTAATLFDEHGYHSTSMEDIAERVGLAKPTLYYYFRSKDEILFEIHTAMIDLITVSHEQRLADRPGEWDALLKEMIGDVVRLMESHPGHLRIFFEHQRELPADYKTTIRAKRNRYREYVRALIDAGIADGVFVDVDPELATLAVLGLANWTYTWLRPGGDYTAEQVTDTFYALLRNGLAVAPAPE